MKSISLKLQDQILEETESLLEHLKTSRNRYINEAIEFYNDYQKKKLIEEQIMKESKLIGKDSMKILKEFESFATKWQFKLNIELRQENNKAMNSLRSINTYRGIRNAQGLPVRGQSSKSNAKTQRKRRRVGAPSSILLKKGGV